MNQPSDDNPTADLGVDDDDDEMFSRRERGRPQLGVSDFVRRAIKDTVGSVERSGSLSKEALGYLLQQGDKGRREVVKIVAKEVGDFLRHTDISSEVVKVLTNLQVDVNASVKFSRDPDGSLSTEVSEDSGVTLRESEDVAQAPVEDED